MPFEIYLTRGTSRTDPGRFPIDANALREALGSSGATVEPAATGEDAFWVRYSESISAKSAGELWCRAAIVDGGVALLSASYSNPRVLRNAIDLAVHAVYWAHLLDARALESGALRAPEAHLRIVSGNVETRLHIDGSIALSVDARASGGGRLEDRPLPNDYEAVKAIYAPTGDRVRALATTHHAARALVGGRTNSAALEVPIGPFDTIHEYGVFEAYPARAIPLDALAEALRRRGRTVRIDAPVIYVFDGDVPVVQALLRDDDDRWQLQPSHAWAMWPRIASTAFEVLREVERLAGGAKIGLVGLPFDERLAREAEAMKSGIEVFVWAVANGAGMPMQRGP